MEKAGERVMDVHPSDDDEDNDDKGVDNEESSDGDPARDAHNEEKKDR